MDEVSEKNVRRRYYQQVLAGFGAVLQPKNKDSDSASEKPSPASPPPFDWQQEKYLVYVPAIIKKTTLPSGQYEIEFSLPLNVELLVSPVSKRGKINAQQVFHIPPTLSKDSGKICMVYGVPSEGSNPLSHSLKSSIRHDTAYIYSRIMVQVGRAVERWLLHVGGGEKGVDDPGKRIPEPLTSTNLGEHKEPEGSAEIRDEVRGKKGAKDSTAVAQDDR